MASFTLEAVVTPGDIAKGDEIAGEKTQVVKVQLGAAGVDGGYVAAGNPLPVTGTLSIGALPAPLNVVGGGTEAAALRVTIANDSTGLLSVDDNGGSLTVDVGASVTLTVDTELPAAAALSDNFANPTAPAVGAFVMGWDPTNANWDRLQSAQEDDAATANPISRPLMARSRQMPLASEVGAFGDWVALNTTERGSLWVSLVDSNGIEAREDDVATANPGGPANMARTRAFPLPVEVSAADDWAALNATTRGALCVTLVNSSGAEVGVAAAAVRVDPTGTTTQPVSIAATVTTQDTSSLVDNAAFTDGTSRVLPAGFVFDEVAGTALTENDIAAARLDSKRAQVLVIEDETTRGRRTTVTAANALKVDGSAVTQPISIAAALPAGNNNIGDVDIASVPAPLNVTGNGAAATALRVTMANDSTGIVAATVAQATASNLNAQVVGSLAHDAAAAGANPLLMGGFSSAAAPTDVSADTDAVRAWYLRNGAQAVNLTAAGTLIPAGGGTEATALRVTVASNSTGVLAVKNEAGGTIAVAQATASNLNAQVVGVAAQDAAISGNPVATGYRASSTTPTAMSASGDVVYPWADLSGATVVTGYVASDAPVAGNIVRVGGRASTATPSAVSADGDAVDPWYDRSGATVVAGYVARDAAIAGNPVLMGGRASTAAPTSVSADNDLVDFWCLRDGSLAVSVQSFSSASSVTVDGHAAHDAAWADRPVPTGLYASIASPTVVSADGDVTRQWADRRGSAVVVPRPSDYGSLGYYALSMATGTMAAGLAANSEIAQFRWTAASNLALIKRVKLDGAGGITAMAAGFVRFEVFVARSFTVAGTGGGTATISGNNQKRRASMGTTGLGEFRMATTAALTAGTKTLDAQAIGGLVSATGVTAGTPLCPPGTLYEAGNEDMYPVVLAQNEGIIIRATVPATGTWTGGVTIEWEEVTAY